MAQCNAHGHAPFTLQGKNPGKLAQDLNVGEQVAHATILSDQFRVLHCHQIGLPGYDRRRADHNLATRKALTLRAAQGKGGFGAPIGLSGSPCNRLAPNSSSTLPLKALGLSSSKDSPSKKLFFFMIRPRKQNTTIQRSTFSLLVFFHGINVQTTSLNTRWLGMLQGAVRRIQNRWKTNPPGSHSENVGDTFACFARRWLARNRRWCRRRSAS